jgi:DNA gyrase subunit A
MGTRRGRIKRLPLSEFASVRPSGLIAIFLDGDDELCWARLTSGSDEILLVTEQGKALRFSEGEVRPTGRQSAGVNGIALRKGDKVASMEIVEPGASLLVATRRGFGKRTPLEEYTPHRRATGGMATIDQHSVDIIGLIASARVVQEEDEVTLITSGGQALRLRVSQVAVKGRSTRGVHLMDLGKEDTLASIARIPAQDLVITNGE